MVLLGGASHGATDGHVVAVVVLRRALQREVHTGESWKRIRSPGVGGGGESEKEGSQFPLFRGGVERG